MDIDFLSGLPVDLFIQHITYLPFEDVISLCSTNTTLHNYCSNPSYNNNWRKLIDDTFENIYNYQEKLKQTRNKLNINEGVYNYLVYSHLVKLLDPITQLMIYYRQDDMKSFDSPNYNNIQRFLALFLLGQKDKMKNYLPSDAYLPFINMLEGHKIDQNKMLIEMAKEASVQGISLMLSKGADVHAQNDSALRWASRNGHLEVVKYLTEIGANIHADNDSALRLASSNGQSDVVKYLIGHAADIHAQTDYSLRLASKNGHLDIVKYLLKNSANIHAQHDEALTLASENDHLEVVRYLVEHGADIHALNDTALISASSNGHLEIVKYLTEQGANIHTMDDGALRLASENGHLEVVKYLTEHGANIHAGDDDALIRAQESGHLEVVKYLTSKE